MVLKFYVDEEDFLHLKRFHHQARDPQYIPGARLQMLLSILLCCGPMVCKPMLAVLPCQTSCNL